MIDNNYVELRARSFFGFLQSTIDPEDLAKAAAFSGYSAIGMTDFASASGFVRFHKSAKQHGIKPLYGTELTVDGSPLFLLCETKEGYRNLCKMITLHQSDLRGKRGLTLFDLESHKNGLFAFTGGAEGNIGKAIDAGDTNFAARKLDTLAGIFGKDHCFVELQIHFDAQEDIRNAALVCLAEAKQLPLVLTNDVRMLGPDQLLLLDTLTCIREKVELAAAGKRLLQNGERYLKTPQAMASLLTDIPEAIQNTVEIANRCTFSLDDAGYRFPEYPLPIGEKPEEFLRAIIFDAAPRRFSTYNNKTIAQLDREWSLICKLGLCGYFLIVWDIIQFCKSRGIFVQGRGSAANSAVCYALGITACDPLKMDLLFERFLSEERGEWPDIDLDLPSGNRREEVIQYLYRKYGASGCALTATYTTYRARSAVRDVGKILGFSEDTISQLSKKLSRFGDEFGAYGTGNLATEPVSFLEHVKHVGLDPSDSNVSKLIALYKDIQDIPRHIGQHPGGMIIAAGRLDEVIPIQPAAMPGRAIIQWDKDDCADMGIVKIDLLGLGMMQVLEEAGRLVPCHDGMPFDIASLPRDDKQVYSMISAADTIGIFQIESRAQMSCLPRTKPDTFYDLVVQVGLIRPGPIVGKMVHPYLKRRMKEEPVSYPHSSLAPILSRTLGIPLFQEQVMRMAMVAAGFSGGLADQLRRAMDSNRSKKKMFALVDQLRIGMQKNGIPKHSAEQIELAITAFAQYGFPESHAISFAWLTYASAYLKAHHPGVFYAALLNAWPMGFYSPATVIRDAQRHGVTVLPLCVASSFWSCSLPAAESATDDNGPKKTVRLGLRYVAGLRAAAVDALVKARSERPFASVDDWMCRCKGLSKEEMTTLAELGALSGLQRTPNRRDALWQVSAWEKQHSLRFQTQEGVDTSPLASMTPVEEMEADFRSSGVSIGAHPLSFFRAELSTRSVLRIDELSVGQTGRCVTVAGLCIIRQRPPTAKGFLFLTLEDETGLLNVIVKPQLLEEQRSVIYGTRLLLLRGVIERNGDAVQLKATHIDNLPLFLQEVGLETTVST